MRTTATDKKVYLNLYVQAALKSALQACAERERRNLGNVSEILLEWANAELQAAGTLTELLTWTALPPAGLAPRGTYEANRDSARSRITR